MVRFDISLLQAMEHKPSDLTDQLKLEISIELANALIDLESNKLIVTQNYTFPMNIFLNFIESEQGYLQLSKLALANFGISSVKKKSLSSLSKTKSQIGVNEYLDNIMHMNLRIRKIIIIKKQLFIDLEKLSMTYSLIKNAC